MGIEMMRRAGMKASWPRRNLGARIMLYLMALGWVAAAAVFILGVVHH